uniref:Uncharacterized protein n=1 Tax=Branchiostoma floridae TaxID=7739 RepID=C3ZQE5_BRAFL|eukprot:XP_002589190.1 hypothetical protein BRAFLDRAFT_74653 [Branchiostoma floridae]
MEMQDRGRKVKWVRETVTTMEACPEVYTTPPVQPKEHKPGQLTREQVKQFFDEAYCDLWVNDRLLNVMEQLVGPEIAGNPLWNLRPKVVRGGHRKGVTADHVGVVGGTWYVEVLEEEMERTLGVNVKTDVVTCEVPYGGVLFINNAIPHRSLPNKTDQIRWSLDLRWQDPDKPSGFWGKRRPVLMRTAKDPTYKVPQSEWDKFFNADRGSELEMSTGLSGKEVDEFDTTVHGPWLTRWPIVRHNRHTRALLLQQGNV